MSLTGKEIAQMHKDYVMQSWSKSGVDALPVERAEGIYFYDYDGNKYADMASLLVCSNLGHELPEIVNAKGAGRQDVFHGTSICIRT